MKMTALFFAAALAAAQTPAVLNYATSCAVVDLDSADGYVTNLSTNTYQVAGSAKFVFSSANDMSQPAISVVTNGIIPPGQTARVAHVKLAHQPAAGESCRFDVSAVIRKP